MQYEGKEEKEMQARGPLMIEHRLIERMTGRLANLPTD
jgi:hypothetical protein